jgi:hypothetical protein
MPKTYTAAGTVAAGDVYTAAAHNIIATDVNNLIVPPSARASRSSDLSYTSNTDIVWNSVAAAQRGYDTDSMWDAGAGARLTMNTPGFYLIVFNWDMTFSGTSTSIEPYLLVDGTNQIADAYINISTTTLYRGTLSTIFNATSGTNFVTARIALGGGTSPIIKATSGGTQMCGLMATWIGRAS